MNHRNSVSCSSRDAAEEEASLEELSALHVTWCSCVADNDDDDGDRETEGAAFNPSSAGCRAAPCEISSSSVPPLALSNGAAEAEEDDSSLASVDSTPVCGDGGVDTLAGDGVDSAAVAEGSVHMLTVSLCTAPLISVMCGIASTVVYVDDVVDDDVAVTDDDIARVGEGDRSLPTVLV